MKISQIVVIVIFIIFLIIHISLVSTSNLDIIVKEYAEKMIELCKDKKSDELINCQNNYATSILNDRDSTINNINIIGIITGILLGVVQINYINTINMNNSIKLVVHSIILIIYIILIYLCGTSYTDDGEYLRLQSKSRDTIYKGKYLQLGLKPLLPFLGALSITSLSIIITSIDELSSKSSNNYSSISSELSISSE
jgi:hypothetical protein